MALIIVLEFGYNFLNLLSSLLLFTLRLPGLSFSASSVGLPTLILRSSPSPASSTGLPAGLAPSASLWLEDVYLS